MAGQATPVFAGKSAFNMLHKSFSRCPFAEEKLANGVFHKTGYSIIVGENAFKAKDFLLYHLESAEKRCRALPAGGLGVFPQTKRSSKIGGLRGLTTAF
jgi:hypothetical protein